jgi:hypothetical protein
VGAAHLSFALISGELFMTQRRCALCGVVMFLSVLATGCGSSGPTVSGRVTYRGAPLTNGGVMILAPDGSSAYGGIGPDGSYTVRNAPKGPVKVTVSVPAAAQLPRPLAAGPPTWPSKRPATSDALAIPRKYGRPDSSGLNWVVEEGSQQHDINLL